MSPVTILGGGVAALCAATALAARGHALRWICPKDAPPAASGLAGGMLAPDCEGETAPPAVVMAGRQAADWWARHLPVTRAGTLVLAPARDQGELDHFARRSRNHRWVDPGALEPSLAGRFTRGLFFPDEAHLDPRAALAALRAGLARQGITAQDAPAKASGAQASGAEDGGAEGWRVDCRALAAPLAGLRPVRGEMALLLAPEVQLTRPVRLLHPRFPCYVVPRGAGVYMLGATMVESGAAGPVTARAAVELISAAYAIDPAFGQAQILELGAGLRPAFADNLPRLIRQGRCWHLNGLYRHGFLMAPALAEQLAAKLSQPQDLPATDDSAAPPPDAWPGPPLCKENRYAPS